MKPARFDYYDPTTLAEALSLLAQFGDTAKPLAGGQSLVPMMNMRLARPAQLVDLNRLGELNYLEVEQGELRIGAMTRQRVLERSEIVARGWPLLQEAARYIGHVQIRNRGTVGGSLVHAYPSAELPVVMTALDATLVLRSEKGERVVRAEEFFVDVMTTVLQPGELLVEVRVPQVPPGSGASFQEVSRRHGDFALMGVAAIITPDAKGNVGAARLVFTGAIPGVRARPKSCSSGSHPSGTSSARRRVLARWHWIRSPTFMPAQSTAGKLPRCSAVAPWKRPRAGLFLKQGTSKTRLDTKVATRKINLTINGRDYRGEVEPRKLLVDFVRDDLGLTGTHVGCEHGVCGACTVLLDNEPVRSCLMFAVQADGVRLGTVEGLAPSATELHPLQQSFWDLHGLQCGFCTPGILLTAAALLKENPDPSEEQIRDWISGNLCRCTGYQNIVAAIQDAAKKMTKPRSTVQSS